MTSASSSSPALPADPADEPQRTSLVFLPFPASLLSRLSPPPSSSRPFFPGISPAPSESDLSDRRYSDVSSASLSTTSSAPAPDDDQEPRLREWEARAHLPHPPHKPLGIPDRSPPHQPLLTHISPPRIPIRNPPPLPNVDRADPFFDDAHTSRSVPTLTLQRGYHHHIGPPRRPSVIDNIRPPEDDSRKRRLRKVWRLLGGRGRKKERDPHPDPPRSNPRTPRGGAVPSSASEPREPRERRAGDSLRRLRLMRGSAVAERSAGSRQSSRRTSAASSGARGRRGEEEEARCARGGAPTRRSVPPAAGRDAASARGHGRRQRSAALEASPASVDRRPLADSPSLGNVGYGYSPQRERVSFADVKREANSFAMYRGRLMFTTEGSSVSSSEDREDEGVSPESGHLFLSRRQLRGMQYK